MIRKLLIDLSPGIEETLALSVAMNNPDVELQAVTAVAGNVNAGRSGQNLQAILNLIDPPRRPRMGVGEEPVGGLPVDGMLVNSRDGLGDVGIPVVELLQPASASKVISDTIRSFPYEVTILTLGPLTNIARALVRDPELALMVGHLVIYGGSLSARGNITPTSEFNIYCDPESARTVFRSKMTKTLVPMDITSKFSVGMDFINQIPDSSSGVLLKKILPALFRNYRLGLGREKVFVHSTVALLSILHPDLFVRKKMFVDVETAGELTTGMTVFDQRYRTDARPNMEVVTDFDKHVVGMFFTEEICR